MHPIERCQELESGEPGYLHVEEQEIGIQLADGCQRFGSVAALRDDLDVVFLFQQRCQAGSSEGLVIYDDRTDSFHVYMLPRWRRMAAVCPAGG